MARGHKSTKVPGVRLRPAPAQGPSKSSADAQAAGSSKRKRNVEEEGEEDGGGVERLNTVSRPFKGAVVCFTGVPDKVALAHMVKELGAVVESNLTDTVTHLVAADLASEKYRVALSHGFVIVADSWIRASHMVWRDGGEVGLDESVQGHHLPIFRDLRICLSGFDLGEKRDNLIKRIREHQGFISRTLDRSCTHLVTPKGESEKVQWAQRANQELTLAIVSNKPIRTIRYTEPVTGPDGKTRTVEKEREQTDIHIIWEEWVVDCLEAGGRWKEDSYSVEIPKAELKRQQVQTQRTGRTAVHAHNSEVINVNTSSGASAGPRKAVPSPLRRKSGTEASNASSVTVTDDAEPAVLKRLRRTSSLGKSFGGDDHASGGLMTEILGAVDLPPSQAGGQSKGKGRALDDSFDETMLGNATSDQTSSLLNRLATTTSSSSTTSRGGVASFSRSNSFVQRPSVAKSISAGGLHTDGPPVNPPTPIPEETEPRSSEPSAADAKPFVGKRFVVRCGKGRTKREMAGCIQSLGGVLVGDDEKGWTQGPDYVVVKLRSGRPQALPTTPKFSPATIVTQSWIHDCYRADALLSPHDSLAHRPLDIDLPVAGASTVRLCTTKLDINEQEFAKVLIDAFGGQFNGNLSRSTTHLVCSSKDVSGEKYRHALDWDIPVVSSEWLVDTAKTGSFPDVASYRLGDSNADDTIDRTAVPDRPSSRQSRERSSTVAVGAPSEAQAPLQDLLEDPPADSRTARTINQAEPLLVADAPPSKIASPSTLRTKAISLPAPSSTARLLTKSTSVSAPLAAAKETPLDRSKSDVLPRPNITTPAAAALAALKVSPKPPAIAADVRAYIEQLDREKKRASPVGPGRVSDEKPAKRKRVLGRQGTTGPTVSVSPSTSRPPSPPLQSSSHPNTPLSSPNHPSTMDESLRVVHDDPDARLARQKLLDSLARGRAYARGEDVTRIGSEYEAELQRAKDEEESVMLAKRIAEEEERERVLASGEQRRSSRRKSGRATTATEKE